MHQVVVAPVERSVSMETSDATRLDAFSTGRTSYLPLIGLPKKRVDFDPHRSTVIEPFSWRNLNAEIARRKSSTSSATCCNADDARRRRRSSSPTGTMARVQRRFKRALVRLRHVFVSDGARKNDNELDERASPATRDRDAADASEATTRPVSRTLARRDSNAQSAKRLAAERKRRRSRLVDVDAVFAIVDRPSDDAQSDASDGEITSELAEIFQHLSVAVPKRARLNCHPMSEDAN